MKMMRQIGRRGYLFRHAYNFLPYLTLFKIMNIVMNCLEKIFKIASPTSLPPYIKIEPTPLCQLRCPGCKQSTANYKTQFRKEMQLSLDDFKRIVAPLSRSLLGISLSNHGEPLLHDDISSLVEYAHGQNVAVSFPTNMSVKLGASSIDGLVRSGLDSISVSLDGASEETYNKYRVGGDFALVLRNVGSLADAKRRYDSRRPRIIWKFVIFDHNKHELTVVKESYKELGFDGYEFVPDNRSDDSRKKRQAYKAELRRSNKGCFWPWHAMIVSWDGEVFPCCTHQSFGLGNAIDTNAREIWRSRKYRLLRQGFSGDCYHQDMHGICRKCMGYDVADSVSSETLPARAAGC